MANEQTNIYKPLSSLLLGGLITVIIFWYLFGKGPGGSSDVTIHSDTTTHYVILKDTGTHTIEKHYLTTQPVNYYNFETHTDTAAVLRDYFTKKLVNDSIQDTLVKIWVKDTLYKNNITYRKYDWKFLKPYQVQKNTTITNTVVTKIYPNGLYAGPRIEVNPTTKKLSGLGVDIDYTTRRVNVGAGYNFLNTGISGKVTFKIFGK